MVGMLEPAGEFQRSLGSRDRARRHGDHHGRELLKRLPGQTASSESTRLSNVRKIASWGCFHRNCAQSLRRRFKLCDRNEESRRRCGCGIPGFGGALFGFGEAMAFRIHYVVLVFTASPSVSITPDDADTHSGLPAGKLPSRAPAIETRGCKCQRIMKSRSYMYSG